MNDIYQKFRQADHHYTEALRWDNKKHDTCRHESDKFEIAANQSKLTLVRCGQYKAGSTNYWDSPEKLNNAILQIIIDDETIIERALEILEADRVKELLACEEEHNKIGRQIAESKRTCLPSEETK